jgi:Sodium:neurotransmitter symporter family
MRGLMLLARYSSLSAPPSVRSALVATGLLFLLLLPCSALAYITGCFAGIMSAYGSFSPATTNIWADNNYVCYINCITSFFAGFAVFSILGNMAHRQREIASGNPQLRVNICKADDIADVICDFDCNLCANEGWKQLEKSV